MLGLVQLKVSICKEKLALLSSIDIVYRLSDNYMNPSQNQNKAETYNQNLKSLIG